MSLLPGAALAAKASIRPRDLEYDRLRKTLEADGVDFTMAETEQTRGNLRNVDREVLGA
jgi:hypothetical protein